MKQKTLLSSWCGTNRQSATSSTTAADAFMKDNDDDIVLLDAMEEMSKTIAVSGDKNKSRLKPLRFSYKATVNDGPLLDGFDVESGMNWTYPTNYPVRDYQLNIVQECLFKNTLVCLPTGLGKTFIAAVVMYNLYQWYPLGKVIFTAPTRPLVTQQMDACYRIMGISSECTAEMTGSMPSNVRQREWKIRRLLFLTPQVMVNDIKSGACPAKQVKCIVVDEAHKATGNHAYCQLIREMAGKSKQFRILALTATPGSDIQTVQEVMHNLLISHIELRTDECQDIKAYSFERNVEKVIVPLGREIDDFKSRFSRILDGILQRLRQQRALTGRSTVATLSKFALLKQKQFLMSQNFMNIDRTAIPFVNRDFSVAISLFHGYELLQQHGLRPLFTYLDNVLKGEKGAPLVRQELRKMPDFQELWNLLENRYRVDPEASLSEVLSSQRDFVSGHPKLDKLLEITLQHFNCNKFGSNSRVIIFSQFRDSVSEIIHMLKKHQPLIKPVSFIGQNTGSRSKGYTQKDQLRVMREFRDGTYNVLVSTCIGEEGLDIGEVDLIICFDSAKSPVRLIQRMGRTGRKRIGRIIMLLSEGKEVSNYNTSLVKKKSIHKAIFDGVRRLQFYPDNPRMVPIGLSPEVNFKEMEIIQNDISSRKRKVVDKSSKNQTTINAILKKKQQAANFLSTQVKASFQKSRDVIGDSVGDVKLERAPLLSLMSKDEIEEKCASNQFENKYHRFNRTTQDTWSVDHSCLTKDCVAVLRLMNDKRRGRTSLMFHALGLRDVNVDDPLTQADPFTRPQNDFSSDDDFDVRHHSVRKSSSGIGDKSKSSVHENHMSGDELFPNSPVFGSFTQTPITLMTSESVKRDNYLTKPMRRVTTPPGMQLIDILIDSLEAVVDTSCEPVRIQELNEIMFPSSMEWDLNDNDDELLADCLRKNDENSENFEDVNSISDREEFHSEDNLSDIDFLDEGKSDQMDYVKASPKNLIDSSSLLSKFHRNVDFKLTDQSKKCLEDDVKFDCNLVFPDVNDLSDWDLLPEDDCDKKPQNSSPQPKKAQVDAMNSKMITEENWKIPFRKERISGQFVDKASTPKNTLLACFHTPKNLTTVSPKTGSARVTMSQAMNMLSASFSFDVDMIHNITSEISLHDDKAPNQDNDEIKDSFLRDIKIRRTSSPKPSNSKNNPLLSNFKTAEIHGKVELNDSFDYNLLVDSSWDHSCYQATPMTSGKDPADQNSKQPCFSTSKNVSTRLSDGDESTFMLFGSKRNKVQVIESDDSESGEDYESPPWLTKRSYVSNIQRKNSSTSPDEPQLFVKKKSKKRNNNRLKPGCKFICSQAVDDDDTEISKCQENSLDNDTYDSSFVNDEYSPDIQQKSKMYAVYAQSLRSSKKPMGKFRLQYEPVVEEPEMIFSQQPEQDDDYERDSFCVSESETPERKEKKSRKRKKENDKMKGKSKRRRLLVDSAELSDSSDFV